MKHILALAALVFALSCFGQSYDLTIEQSYPLAAPGMTYRLYIEANDPTDKLGGIFGNDEKHLVFATPDGIFNSPFNSTWDATGINPAWITVFPDLADDSYAAINDLPVAITGDEWTQAAIAGYFMSGGDGFNVNSLTGGGWSAQCEWDLMPPTSCGALGDPVNGRWLIAQVTTTGSFSGTINAQIFPLGVGVNQIQQTWQFEDGVVIDPCFEWYDECGVCGGSGIPEGACDCDGNVLDVCGDCGGTGYFGFTDSGACNYDAGACGDDGSCEFVSCGGCTDPVACNYDPTMLLDDGSCDYCFCGPGTEYDTESGQCLIVVEDAGYCGPGTYWVEALNKCFISTPGDTDFEGCVGVADLLGLLSFFCNCEGDAVAAWSCGAELEYQGACTSQWKLGSNVGLGRTFKTQLSETETPSLQARPGHTVQMTGSVSLCRLTETHAMKGGLTVSMDACTAGLP